MLVHSVHLALVMAGLAGTRAPLGPTVPHRSRPGARPGAARDVHDARTGALRAAVARYAADGSLADLLSASDRSWGPPAPPGVRGSTVLVPLAVTGSLMAAGIHAALVPAHLQERVLFGAFFVVVAVAQLGWAERGLRRPSRGWLLAGPSATSPCSACGRSRTLGLPFGLLPRPARPSGWDVACAVAELAVVASCAVGLRAGVRRIVPWREWNPAVHASAALAATVVVVLALTPSWSGGHG